MSQKEPEPEDGRAERSISESIRGLWHRLRGERNRAKGYRAPSNRRAAKVCVIGAGSCGLVALKALRAEGLDCQAFEMSDRLGGLWVFGNSNGRGGAYRSLRINTSARAMELDGLPWPPGTPDYPHHGEVARYLEAYAERFDLLRHIELRTEVRDCSPHASGGYDVTTLDNGTGQIKTTHFDAVVVANGHHWLPSMPDHGLTAAFTGSFFHSHRYVDPELPVDLKGKRVLIVGMGNSAVDIASELASQTAVQEVYLSTRRGVWVLPKYIRGKPVDQGQTFPTWLPAKFRRRLVTAAFIWLYGKMEDVGLPRPDHLIGEAHPTLSDELPTWVKKGRVLVRPGLRGLAGRTASFDDGSAAEVDTVIFATGYQIDFPFFSPTHIHVEANRLPLFHRVFHPSHRHVFFVGLAQPLGAILPVATLQAEWIAEHLAGRYSLPEEKRMRTEVAREESKNADRYVPSPRHTMQIDPLIYARVLQRERKAGRLRATRGEGMAFAWGGGKR